MDGHKNMDSSGVEPKVDLLQWDVSETGTFIKELFSEEISRKFEEQDINGRCLEKLLRKDEDASVFKTLGLLTFGQVIRLKTRVEEKLKLSNTGISLRRMPSPSPSNKPSMLQLASLNEDQRLLYKSKRNKIQRAAVQKWPGNHFPNFRMPEYKQELDELASSLVQDCSMLDIGFNVDGIKEHIKSVFWERRRARKRDGIDYDKPDGRTAQQKVKRSFSTHGCKEGFRNSSKKPKLHEPAEDEESLPDTEILDDSETEEDSPFSSQLQRSKTLSAPCKFSSEPEEDLFSSQSVARSKSPKTSSAPHRFSSEPEEDLFSSQSVARSKSPKTSSAPRKCSSEEDLFSAVQSVTRSKSPKTSSAPRKCSSEEDLFSAVQSVARSKTASAPSKCGSTKGKSNAFKNMDIRVKKEVKSDDDGSGDSSCSREVTALNLSDKSAAVVVLCFAEKMNMDEVSREEMVQLLKKLGTKASMLTTMSKKQVTKALAVKLINQGRVALAKTAKLSNIKRDDVTLNF